ncbi:hypothetical protein, partial [Cutibacterium sp.]
MHQRCLPATGKPHPPVMAIIEVPVNPRHMIPTPPEGLPGLFSHQISQAASPTLPPGPCRACLLPSCRVGPVGHQIGHIRLGPSPARQTQGGHHLIDAAPGGLINPVK